MPSRSRCPPSEGYGVAMLLSPSARGAELAERVRRFIEDEIAPIEAAYHQELTQARAAGTQWAPLPRLVALREKARAEGLWNLFLPAGHEGDYAARFGTA